MNAAKREVEDRARIEKEAEKEAEKVKRKARNLVRKAEKAKADKEVANKKAVAERATPLTDTEVIASASPAVQDAHERIVDAEVAAAGPLSDVRSETIREAESLIGRQPAELGRAHRLIIDRINKLYDKRLTENAKEVRTELDREMKDRAKKEQYRAVDTEANKHKKEIEKLREKETSLTNDADTQRQNAASLRKELAEEKAKNSVNANKAVDGGAVSENIVTDAPTNPAVEPDGTSTTVPITSQVPTISIPVASQPSTQTPRTESTTAREAPASSASGATDRGTAATNAVIGPATEAGIAVDHFGQPATAQPPFPDTGSWEDEITIPMEIDETVETIRAPEDFLDVPVHTFLKFPEEGDAEAHWYPKTNLAMGASSRTILWVKTKKVDDTIIDVRMNSLFSGQRLTLHREL